MDRRDFLKTLGLAGVALTLPKPLDIIAAKMADIAEPPLHVGYCHIGPLADEERCFVMNRMSVGTESTITRDRYEDYHNKWVVAAFRKFMLGEKAARSTLLKMRTRHMPSPTHIPRICYLPNNDPDEYKAVEVADYFPVMHAYRFTPGESLEFWFTPGSRDDLPKFPLPKLTIALGGHMIYKKEPPQTGKDYMMGGRTMGYFMMGEVKTLQLERAKAIEMGLCPPAEEEGIIA